MFYNRPQVLDLLAANNLKFVTDDRGKPVLDMSRKRGIVSVEPTEPSPYTPSALYAALNGAERAEKEFMRTGQRPLAIDNRPKDSDYAAARLIAAHLTNDSLKKLASRGLHGRHAGDRAVMEKAVADLIYKGSFGRDLYTGAPIVGMDTQMGHTTANSLGGTDLRQELAAINMSLHDSEGADRLEAIRRKKVQLDAMKAIEANPELLNDPEIQRLVMGDKTFVKDLLQKAEGYGFDMSGSRGMVQSQGPISDSQGQVVGEKPLVINADEGSQVFVHTNGNGNGHKNGHAKTQKAFNELANKR